VLAAGCLLALLTAAVPDAETDAGSRPVEVQFEGPAACSEAKAFFASLRSRTTHVRTAENDEPRTTLQVRLSRDRAHVVGELRIIDDSGATDTRRVRGATCDDVVQALSLTAALALDPTAVLSVSPEEPGTSVPALGSAASSGSENPPTTDKAPVVEKKPEPVAEKPEKPALEETPTSPPRPVPGFTLGAKLLGLSLLDGKFSPGLEFEAHKNLGHGPVFRPALGLALVYARNDVLHTPSAAAAALLAAGATVCPVRLSAGLFTAQPCAALWAGMLRTAGRQLTRENQVSHFWLSAGLTLRLLATLGHGFALQAEAGFQSPLIRRRYYATIPSNVIAETPTISPVVGLGLTYGF
jgi:hypothetical protein